MKRINEGIIKDLKDFIDDVFCCLYDKPCCPLKPTTDSKSREEIEQMLLNTGNYDIDEPRGYNDVGRKDCGRGGCCASSMNCASNDGNLAKYDTCSGGKCVEGGKTIKNTGKKIKMRESELINIINKVINESKHKGSYMAKKQLWGIAEKAKDMAERLPDNTQLEDWMESHIAKADSMMDSVYDSFDYDNQMDIPGFEGTMGMLDDITIREESEVLSEGKTCWYRNNRGYGAKCSATWKGSGRHGSSCMNRARCLSPKGADGGRVYADNDYIEYRDVYRDDYELDNYDYVYGPYGIREESDEIVALHKQDTSYRDQETGAVVASTQMLDRMDAKLDNLTNVVDDLYDNLSRRWS